MTAFEVFLSLVAGEPVEVAFVAPRDEALDGVTYRRADGRLHVEVRPGLSPRDHLALLLHEAAHCSLHGGQLEAPRPEHGAVHLSHSELMAQVSAIAPELVESFEAAHAAREDEADRLAHLWLEFAEREAGEGASLEAKIDCLIDAFLAGRLPLP